MIHQTADVSPRAKIGKNVKIWHFSRIREGARIGNNCIIGGNVYVDRDVTIGSNVKIQNNALVYSGANLEDGVFIGPNVCLTNDKYPRAIASSGKLKTENDWKVGKIIVKKGASIGAGSVIIPNVKIGSYSLIAAGSVVTKSVPAHTLVAGNPARFKGYVCTRGHPMTLVNNGKKTKKYFCKICHKNYFLKNE